MKRVLTIAVDSNKYEALMELLGESDISLEFLEDHEEGTQ